MTLPRRRFLAVAAGAAAWPFIPQRARADAYPTRPVRMINGFPAGGPSDIFGRLFAQWLSERLGQPFLMESRPGAGSNIATEYAVRAPADGYTLFVMTSANTINATLYDSLPYNFIRDMAPVASFVRVPQVLEIHPSLPVQTVPEFITYAKENPGKLTMGSAGIGTIQHVAGELFKFMTGVDIVHVPYRGQAPAMVDLLGGQIQLMFDTVPAALPSLKAGKLRPLAVTTKTRFPPMPELPVMADFVPGYESSALYGLMAPKATPTEILERLNHEINAAMATEKMQARIAELGCLPLAQSREAFAALIVEETAKWGKVIKEANMKPE